ncbi:hypothetical protein CO058_04265 [candidate division WWE3 bacterium CG_4_9_14_0_2_um_filter_35_11]|uniref:Uncharacterized protein n=1 Tax=candidate division WWE3 bacterium CG_4_9_14_0_2_um_filter_35_11 TaxID=1975077 RepID=A0A2M8EKM5_UNCKA|nr:MAG: hypothetical protein COV25_01170 [candidate division WWE3 bacterium CG10_big_fil_rev_8_21_14_0_10_35_32]PJC23291.1 MAG: hypothetical protein CO058_04265 [candidate division WWE3 bacterium CG_4_9_14_0_2_um_filter_35_11]
MKHINPLTAGILQALGVVLYIFILVSLIFPLSQNFVVPTYGGVNFASFFVLLFFSSSVLTCGVITFAYPFQLVLKKNVKDAVAVIISMGITLVLFLAIISLIVFFTGKTTLQQVANLQSTHSEDFYRQKATEAKQRLEDKKMMYENNKNEVSPDVKTINIEPQISPYSIDINTGEKTLIEP